MQGDIALAGFMMTAEEWAALDAPSRALLLALAAPRPVTVAAPADFEHEEAPVEVVVYAVGTGPITDEDPTV